MQLNLTKYMREIATADTVALGAAIKILTVGGDLAEGEARLVSCLNPVGWKRHGAAAMALAARLAVE